MKHNRLLATVLFVSYIVTSGCAAVVAGAAAGTAGVIWYKGNLQETVPYSVPAVHRAALSGLNDLDIRIVEERRDELTSEIRGLLADGTKVWIDAKSTGPNTTKITTRVGVLGDKTFSLRIRDAMKRHL
jgi:hypothetical protein